MWIDRYKFVKQPLEEKMKKVLSLLSILAMVCVFAVPKAFADTYTLTVASSNPSSGVPITVSPNDRNGRGNGTTQFTRSYRDSTSITLTAPATTGGHAFQKWQRDGSDYSTNRTITFSLSRNRTMRAVFTTSTAAYTLTVASSNPGSGIAITVSPTDRNGLGNGSTQFTRSYTSGASVTLSAPATAGGNIFQKWQKNGIDAGTSQAVGVTMTANTTMTAVYVTPTVTSYTLTVASSNPGSGVAITVSLTDRNGLGNGSTQFTRSYTSGAAVTLTAPATAGGNNFQKWQKNGVDAGTSQAVGVTMTANTTMTAVFGTTTSNSNYVILASNDLGMHCACPGVGNFLLLPPFNTIRAQAFQKGGDPIALGDTSKYRMTYSIVENTDDILKADPYYADWIVWSPKLFPGYLPIRADGRVQSVSGATVSGDMTVKSGSGAWWEVVGTPAFPVVTGTSTDIMIDPLGGPNRTPYLTGRIQLLDKATSAVLATDDITVPVAFGGCCTCHLKVATSYGYSNPTTTDSFTVMGWLHSNKGAAGKIDFAKLDPTNDGRGGPIRCSWCHWDPAMGESAAPGLPSVWPNYSILPGANFTKADVKVSQYTFSDVLHRFHAQNTTVLSVYDPNIAKNCYDCHPGNNVNCYRDTHTTKSINGNAIWCTDCHGDLNQRVAQNQLAQPWQASTLPKCSTCHGSNYGEGGGSLNTGIFGEFLNSSGHEGQKVLCSSCHGSPHALNSSTLAKDNAQNIRLQNDSRAIGVCNVCHTSRSNTWAVPPH
jgi:hypothetical protein